MMLMNLLGRIMHELRRMIIQNAIGAIQFFPGHDCTEYKWIAFDKVSQTSIEISVKNRGGLRLHLPYHMDKYKRACSLRQFESVLLCRQKKLKKKLMVMMFSDVILWKYSVKVSRTSFKNKYKTLIK